MRSWADAFLPAQVEWRGRTPEVKALKWQDRRYCGTRERELLFGCAADRDKMRRVREYRCCCGRMWSRQAPKWCVGTVRLLVNRVQAFQ